METPTKDAREIQRWLQRFDILYAEIKESPSICIDGARRTLFDAGARTSQRERVLLALLDHPDPRAGQILEHRTLVLRHPRLVFLHELVLRRRRRRRSFAERRCAA